jgi:hypothetical protein
MAGSDASMNAQYGRWTEYMVVVYVSVTRAPCCLVSHTYLERGYTVTVS